MGSLEKLFRARSLLEQNPTFKDMMLTLFINLKLKRLKIVLKDGTKIYIQYNNYQEYSYSVLFSSFEGDRCRFDNYDNLWEVPSRPTTFTRESP
jgi:hypothetical protein